MVLHKKAKSRKKREKRESMKIILTDTPGQDEEYEDGEMGGIFWDKADMQLIYHALLHYKPTPEEQQVWEILCEEFEETLYTSYGIKPSWMKK